MKPLTPKKCAECQKLFSPKKKQTIFCSRNCYIKSTIIKKKNCKNCDTTFTPKKKGQLYCSLVCFNNYGVFKTCPKCAKSFFSKQSNSNYCSDNCEFETITLSNAEYNGWGHDIHISYPTNLNLDKKAFNSRVRDYFMVKSIKDDTARLEQISNFHILPPNTLTQEQLDKCKVKIVKTYEYSLEDTM